MKEVFILMYLSFAGWTNSPHFMPIYRFDTKQECELVLTEMRKRKDFTYACLKEQS